MRTLNSSSIVKCPTPSSTKCNQIPTIAECYPVLGWVGHIIDSRITTSLKVFLSFYWYVISHFHLRCHACTSQSNLSTPKCRRLRRSKTPALIGVVQQGEVLHCRTRFVCVCCVCILEEQSNPSSELA